MTQDGINKQAGFWSAKRIILIIAYFPFAILLLGILLLFAGSTIGYDGYCYAWMSGKRPCSRSESLGQVAYLIMLVGGPFFLFSFVWMFVVSFLGRFKK